MLLYLDFEMFKMCFFIFVEIKVNKFCFYHRQRSLRPLAV